jgi:hypothetical protein
LSRIVNVPLKEGAREVERLYPGLSKMQKVDKLVERFGIPRHEAAKIAYTKPN